MKVLHISDAHITKYGNCNLAKIAVALQTEKISIDLCLFTGDLVHKFSHDLTQAFELLKTELIDKLDIKNIVISCGNHDVNRDLVGSMFADHITKLDQMDLINNFVMNNKANEFVNSLSHIAAYNDLVRTIYQDSITEHLYSIHNMEIDGKSIAIVSINTAWSAYSKIDLSSLIFPSAIIEEAAKKIAHAQFKILITHFAPDMLKPSLRKYVRNVIEENFDCLFCGHTHEPYQCSSFTSDNGIFMNTAGTSIHDFPNDNKGFAVLEIDTTNYEVKVQNFNMFLNRFLPQDVLDFTIPTDKRKTTEISIRKAIENKTDYFTEVATKLIASPGYANAHTFLDVFVDPILKPYIRDEGISIRKEDSTVVKTKEISISELSKGTNYVIFGKEKTGKTTLLYKKIIDTINCFNSLRTIPLYYDCKEDLIKGECSFDLEKCLISQYNFSKTKIKNTVLGQYNVLLLIDNLTLTQPKFVESLFKCLSNHNKLDFIAVSSDILVLEDNQYSLPFTKLEISDMSRRELRVLTNKWPLSLDTDKEQVITKLTTLFSHLKIHFNYWTVSLFLYVYEKTSDISLQNNSELLELYIEAIIDKVGLSSEVHKEFSYDDYRRFFAYLAHYLLKNRFDTGYCMSYAELLRLFDEYKDPNPRIVAESDDVIRYAIKKEILTKVSSDKYTFRLNSVFEYFLAYYMKNNEGFRKEIYQNDNKILQFKNELELYSGFERNDSDLLDTLFENTKRKGVELMQCIDSVVDYESITQIKDNTTKQLCLIMNDLKDEIQPIAISLIDEAEDSISPLNGIDSAVTVKKENPPVPIDINLYTEFLSVLGRVFRNIDQIQDATKVTSIFRFILDQSCLVVFYAIKDLVELVKKGTKIEGELEQVINAFNSLSPIITHSFMYEFLNHPTMAKIIETEINELKNNAEKNQYKLFVLYFLLIENNLDKNIDITEDLLAASTSKYLKKSVFIKLILLIAFKCQQKPSVVGKIKVYLGKIHHELYPEWSKINNQPKSTKDIINNLVASINSNGLG